MKSVFTILPVILVFAFAATSCDKIEELGYVKVTLGAQDNTTDDGFYAVEENATYTMAEAADNQAVIDIFCFFEGGDTGNNIALASPGTGITGIFTGDDAPETWTTQNTTFFFLTALTEQDYSSVQEGDDLIVSSFDSENARRKAKDLQPGQVWSVLTDDGFYGLLYVTSVTQGAEGKATFLLKTKQVAGR